MAHHHAAQHTQQAGSWTERVGTPPAAPAAGEFEERINRQSFHRTHTSHGATHWVYLAGTMAPTVLAEFITDPGKYRKAVRLTSVATALAYEALYTYREHQHRQEQDAKLAECRSRE